jgi:hypothetical protein
LTSAKTGVLFQMPSGGRPPVASVNFKLGAKRLRHARPLQPSIISKIASAQWCSDRRSEVELAPTTTTPLCQKLTDLLRLLVSNETRTQGKCQVPKAHSKPPPPAGTTDAMFTGTISIDEAPVNTMLMAVEHWPPNRKGGRVCAPPPGKRAQLTHFRSGSLSPARFH